MALDLIISMTLGNVYENAHAESLNKTFKRQEINVSDYDSKSMAAQSIFRFKEIYNNYRPHSSLGMLAPSVFMRKYSNWSKSGGGKKNIYKLA